MQRIVYTAVPGIREVERAVQELRLHHALDILAAGYDSVGVPVVDEVLGALGVLYEVLIERAG